MSAGLSRLRQPASSCARIQLLLNRVLQQFLYWVFEAVGPHTSLQVGCDIRLKAKEMGFQLSLEDSVFSYFSGCSASISLLEVLSNP